VTPEQEEHVRRALAAAGRDDPAGPSAGMPPEVAARLDEVLEELAAPRRAREETSTGTGAGGHVVPFADGIDAQRRRRRPQALVIAAVVSVIALAGGAVATGGFGALSGGGDSTSAGSAASGTRDDAGDEAQAPSGANGLAPKTAGGDALAAVPRLRRDHLRGDVDRLLNGGGVAAFGVPPAREGASASPPSPTGARSPGARCVRPATGAGDRLVAVRLDGRRATLLLRPAAGGTREAQVYSCGDPTTPVASTEVTSR
jgi:hypothetical protein